ncbi:MAG: NAD-dependent epimerase/dehydratase family protein [Fibrobacteria bacterium]|nr:NAD-dependent epimerase/dehydratase family protein [Fibrobacteria bacterium]
MKILITGICGFVGSTLVKTWKELGNSHEIYGLDNFIRPGSETNRSALKKMGVRLFHGDIRLPSDFDVLPKVDYVIDAAANPSVLAGISGETSSRQLIEHNLGGTINMLEYCKLHKAGFLLLSTSRVYAINPLANLPLVVQNNSYVPNFSKELPGEISTEGISEGFSTQGPISLYGSTKLASEVLALEYGTAFDFPVWVNRCGVLAGAGQFGRAEQGIFSFWIHSWKKKNNIKYIGFGGKGHQVRDCLHPRDIVFLIEKQIAYQNNDKQRLINVSGGIKSSISLSSLSDWCENRFGKHTVASDPKPRKFDLPWVVLDSQKAKEIWDWEPKTTREQILAEIADHAEKKDNWLDLSAPF